MGPGGSRGLREQSFRLGGLGEVRGHHPGARPRSWISAARGVGLFAGMRQSGPRCSWPLVGERQGDGSANAFRAAGHKRGLALERRGAIRHFRGAPLRLGSGRWGPVGRV